MSTQHWGTPPRSDRPSGKKRAVFWISVLLLLVVGGFAAKFSYHWLKAQRASQFAAEGEEFAKAKKWNESAEKYRAALQLDPLGYRGLRGAARLATRLGRPEDVDLWEQVAKVPECTTQD